MFPRLSNLVGGRDMGRAPCRGSGHMMTQPHFCPMQDLACSGVGMAILMGFTTTSTGERNNACNFCGTNHFIRDCEQVNDYVRAGKCKQNIEGKVVLPSGSFVPHSIQGALLRDRIEEWHRQNPNQLAAGTMMNEIISPNVEAAATTSTTTIFQLSDADR